MMCLGFGCWCFGWGWLLGCFLRSLIVVCDFCFALLDCCVNSVVFMIYVCVFVLF